MGGMKLINTNPKFGMEGPYEAESKDSFVKQMDLYFYGIAKEWYGNLSAEEAEKIKYIFDPIEQKAAELREEFRKGLEEVKDGLFSKTEKDNIRKVLAER